MRLLFFFCSTSIMGCVHPMIVNRFFFYFFGLELCITMSGTNTKRNEMYNTTHSGPTILRLLREWCYWMCDWMSVWTLTTRKKQAETEKPCFDHPASKWHVPPRWRNYLHGYRGPIQVYVAMETKRIDTTNVWLCIIDFMSCFFL